MIEINYCVFNEDTLSCEFLKGFRHMQLILYLLEIRGNYFRTLQTALQMFCTYGVSYAIRYENPVSRNGIFGMFPIS